MSQISRNINEYNELHIKLKDQHQKRVVINRLNLIDIEGIINFINKNGMLSYNVGRGMHIHLDQRDLDLLASIVTKKKIDTRAVKLNKI